MGILNFKKNLDSKCKDLSYDIKECIDLLEATKELLIDFIPELKKGNPSRSKDFQRLVEIGTEQASILANNRRVYFEDTNFQNWFRYWDNEFELSKAETKSFMNSLGRYVGKFDLLLYEISNLTDRTQQKKLKKAGMASKKPRKKNKSTKKVGKVGKKITTKKKIVKRKVSGRN